MTSICARLIFMKYFHTADLQEVHVKMCLHCRVQGEVKAIYDEYLSKVARNEVVRLPPVLYNTSFLKQVRHW
jgi:hypothetical protein